MRKSTPVLVFLFIASMANIINVRGEEEIRIRFDGSITPSTAPIQQVGDIYTLTGNITCNADGVIIEKDNVVFDGGGYTINGAKALDSKGISLSSRSNITIRNIKVTNFYYGLYFYASTNCYVIESAIVENIHGIMLGTSAYCVISENNVSANSLEGIYLYFCSNYNILSNSSINGNNDAVWLDYSHNNIILGNNMTNNNCGINTMSSPSNNTITKNCISENSEGIRLFDYSHKNRITWNNMTNNYRGIYISHTSSNNSIIHNNFIDNTIQAQTDASSVNTWDNGYPSGGNYWNDYTGFDSNGDGMGDMPYVIDAKNKDNYPHTALCVTPEFSSILALLLFFVIIGTCVVLCNSSFDRHR